MRVGIDLDGVIYDFEGALRDWCAFKYGWDRNSLIEATQWELANDWGITREQFVTACEESVAAGWMFNYGAPINDARLQLQRLINNGHSVHLITARDFGSRTQMNTHLWLARFALTYNTLDFSHSKTVRPVDAMIDDKPGNVEELVAVGVDAYLQDRPYNRDFDYPKRVKDLESFVDQVVTSSERAA